MKQIFFLFFTLSSVMFADYLYQPSNICIEKYWYAGGSFYYVRSDNGSTYSVTTKSLGDDVFNGYDYNTTSGQCVPKTANNDLGMRDEDFNLLNGVIALIVVLMLIGTLL